MVYGIRKILHFIITIGFLYLVPHTVNIEQQKKTVLCSEDHKSILWLRLSSDFTIYIQDSLFYITSLVAKMEHLECFYCIY